MVAKVCSDAIEELDDGPRQQIFAAILSQLTPQLIAIALHRFDINLRTSVLFGHVGVGGVGLAVDLLSRALCAVDEGVVTPLDPALDARADRAFRRPGGARRRSSLRVGVPHRPLTSPNCWDRRSATPQSSTAPRITPLSSKACAPARHSPAYVPADSEIQSTDAQACHAL